MTWAWSLARALDAHRILGPDADRRTWDKLGVDGEELRRWDHMARRLRLEFLDTGVLSQFEGYGRLAELPLDDYRRRYRDIGRLDLILEAEGDSTSRYQVSKQADVLMLLYLFSAEELTSLIETLGYAFDPAVIPATVDYYLERTTHGSTLSRIVHSWVLSRRNRRQSWQMLGEALGCDLGERSVASTRRGYTWARWRAASTSCSAAIPASTYGRACCGYTPSYRPSCVLSRSTSTTATTGCTYGATTPP